MKYLIPESEKRRNSLQALVYFLPIIFFLLIDIFHGAWRGYNVF